MLNSVERHLFGHINWSLLVLTLVLFFIGIINLYSAGGVRVGENIDIDPYYQKQLIWGVAGFVLMITVTFFDYRRLKTLVVPIFFLTLILLFLVPIIGKTIYGAKRWIYFGFFNLQPSEIAKISVLIMAARLLSRNRATLDFKELFFIVTVSLLPCVLIVIQPDLGTALSIVFIVMGMILFRGIKANLFRVLCVIVPALIPLGWFYLHDYQKMRILTFLNPENDPRGSGYHIIQSQIAIGSGELWGKGYMAGTQSQLKFLPEKHTDFVIAVFGEEWGFVGCVVLLAIYCAFLFALFNSIQVAKDRFGSFLVVGVFFYFFWQILINIGMVLGLMPVVGIPLPFLSYGGSATLVNFFLIGLVLNVSMRRFVFKAN